MLKWFPFCAAFGRTKRCILHHAVCLRQASFAEFLNMNGLLLLLSVLYALLSGLVWRRWQRAGSAPYPVQRELAALLPIMLLHTALVWIPLTQQQSLAVGLGDALVLVSWLMVLLYGLGSFFYSLKGLQLLLYPCIAAALLLAWIFPGRHAAYPVSNLPFMLHVSASLLAYSLFAITALLAVLILFVNRQLHRHRISAFTAAMPPLLSIEKMMFQGLWAGFILLTVAVLSGTVFAEAVFGAPAAFTHKTVFGMASWLIYAVILFRRHTRAWRGKKAAQWMLAAFACLMLAYIGSKFVLEVLLGR